MKPHIPADLPVQIDHTRLIGGIARAHHELGSLSGSLLHPGVNPELLITPLLTKEAVLSSSIEGTVATIEQVFRYETDEDALDHEELRRDAQEIVNYRNALLASMDELKKRAIGESLLKNAHVILLNSVRGQRKSRGKFRTQQVFIGKPGSKIEDASFIPAPPQQIQRLMSNWEAFINSRDQKDPLVQIAVAHYQFEAIHPFLDGNGRIGRLIIPLFLLERSLLPAPLLYVSEYFENDRAAYIDALREVDIHGNWEEWVSYFLTAVEVQAKRTQQSVLKIMRLYDDLKGRAKGLGSVYGSAMLDEIFMRPVVNYSHLRSVLGASHQTIYNLLDKFEQAGILVRAPGRTRNRIYVFVELITLLS